MVILLSIEESEEEVLSGFPKYIIFSTNIPATIFYTLDGSEPNENSIIFVEKLVFPTHGTSFTLKAKAISGEMESAVFEKTYVTEQNLEKARRSLQEGINILPPGEDVVDNLSFDFEGNLSQTTSIPLFDLDLISSTSNEIGEGIPGNSTIDFIRFALDDSLPDRALVSNPANPNFDPKAVHIIIDGSSLEKLEEQVVKIVNRPHGTMEPTGRLSSYNSGQYNLNTANFVRSMINPKTGKRTSYYFDSRDNRWIKSTQVVEGKGLNLTPKSSGRHYNSFVFRWINHRNQTLIY